MVTTACFSPHFHERRWRFSPARNGIVFAASVLPLLPVLLQVLLYRLYLVGVSRAKPSLVVDIDDTGILKADDHIGMMVAIDINEGECDRNEFLTAAVE